VAAGPATVLRSRYFTDTADRRSSCYGGGLTEVAFGGSQMIVVGATEPFRNGRIGEAGNAALATALLGRDQDVIWLDLHETEPRPRPESQSEVDGPLYEQPDREGGGGVNPMWQAFPAWFWASLGLLGVLGLLVATVAARRLGPPVAEPLPVVVPATETVTGRGRLYARIRARGAALETFRTAVVRRIAPMVDPHSVVSASTGRGATTVDDKLVEYVAARTGWAPQEVSEILRGSAPQTDEELRLAVARLDALLDAVLTVGGSRGER
jgi:hypothetical protein